MIDTDDDAPAAPGDLEILQRFLNLHTHDAEGLEREPSTDVVRRFLVERGLLAPEERFGDADREMYLELRRALRALIGTNEGRPLSQADAGVLDRLAVMAGLHPRFRPGREPRLEPEGEGVAAAFGRIVAIAFVSAFDGTFAHLKACAADDCRAVFYDRSKNHSGRWCSMGVCGNRAKVRAWRERQRAAR